MGIMWLASLLYHRSRGKAMENFSSLSVTNYPSWNMELAVLKNLSLILENSVIDLTGLGFSWKFCGILGVLFP